MPSRCYVADVRHIYNLLRYLKIVIVIKTVYPPCQKMEAIWENWVKWAQLRITSQFLLEISAARGLERVKNTEVSTKIRLNFHKDNCLDLGMTKENKIFSQSELQQTQHEMHALPPVLIMSCKPQKNKRPQQIVCTDRTKSTWITSLRKKNTCSFSKKVPPSHLKSRSDPSDLMRFYVSCYLRGNIVKTWWRRHRVLHIPRHNRVTDYEKNWDPVLF